jgi:hypothetical protein
MSLASGTHTKATGGFIGAHTNSSAIYTNSKSGSHEQNKHIQMAYTQIALVVKDATLMWIICLTFCDGC